MGLNHGLEMQSPGRYAIIGEIASGATATVYLAEDLKLKRKVALKKLHPHLWNHAEAVRRFEKEAVAVASLSHDNVIKIFDFGSEDRGLYLAMEYVDGPSLESLLKWRPGGLPNLTALSIFHQLLSGLAAAHSAGIYHRDIKPSNILLDGTGRVRIADFGIAFLSEETSITKTGSYLGTPGYSAPEQADGLPATDRTDIFAAGILFYRCLTGRLPFEADTPHAILIAIMEKTPVRANLIQLRILPGLAELVDEMLVKDPARRPSSIQCLEKLEQLAERCGFPLEETRICRFMEDSLGYGSLEYAEISVEFAAQARQAQEEGRQREALLRFSLADIFAEPDSEIGREAAGFLARQAIRRRWEKWIFITLVLACVAGIGLGVQSLLPNGSETPVLPMPLPVKPQPKAPTAEIKPADQLPESLSLPLPKASVVLVPPVLAPAETVSTLRPLPNSRKAVPIPLPAEPLPLLPETSVVMPAAISVEAKGFVVIKSNPPFARVRIDGRLVGTTPINEPLELVTGPHTLVLEKEGCAPLHSNWEVMPGETASLRFTLAKADGAAP